MARRGLPALRAAIAGLYSARGLPTSVEEVLVTTGAQQAIDLLVTLLLADGGCVLSQNPTYFGALDAARRPGVTTVGIASDNDGPVLDELMLALKKHPVRMVYLMTECHNPTGRTMSPARRSHVLDVCASHGVPVVDDATLAELLFKPSTRSFAGVRDGRAEIATIGSLSKLVWPGLRIGWVRASAPRIVQLGRLKLVADLGSAHVTQALATRLMPAIDEIAKARREQLSERSSIFASALAEALPSWRWRKPDGGPFLWVELPGGDGEAYAQRALRHGVRVLAGRKLSTDGGSGAWLRLSYVAEPARLRLATLRMRDAWHAEYKGTRSGSLEVVV